MSPTTTKGLTGAAFVTLLLTAFMMGANHVAARTAFNHGLDVVTAVTVRSVLTAGVVALILWHQKWRSVCCRSSANTWRRWVS